MLKSGKVAQKKQLPPSSSSSSSSPLNDFVSPPPTRGVFRSSSSSSVQSDAQKSKRLVASAAALKHRRHNDSTTFTTGKKKHPVVVDNDDSQNNIVHPPISKAVTLSEDEQSPRFYVNELQQQQQDEQPQNGLMMSDHSYWAMLEGYFGGTPPNTESNNKDNNISESSSQQVDLQELLGDSILSVSCDTATSSKASSSSSSSAAAVGYFTTPDSKLSTCSVQVHPPSPRDKKQKDDDSMLVSPASCDFSLKDGKMSPVATAAAAVAAAAEVLEAEDDDHETHKNGTTTKLSVPSLPPSEPNETAFQNITQLSLPSEPSLSPDKQSYSCLDDKSSSSSCCSSFIVSPDHRQQHQTRRLSEPSLSPPAAAKTTRKDFDSFATFHQNNSTHTMALTKESQHYYLNRIAQLEKALQRYQGAAIKPPAAAGNDNNETKSLWERNQTLVKEVRFADQTCVELSVQLQAVYAENERLQLQLELLQKQQEQMNQRAHSCSSSGTTKQEWERQQAALTMQHEQDRLPAQQKIEALQSQLQEMESSWKAKENQIMQDHRQLQARLASTEQEGQVYIQQLEQSNQQKELLQQRICELEHMNQEQSGRLEQLQAGNEQKTLESTLVRDQLVAAQQTILDKDQQIADLHANTEILQSQMEQSLMKATNAFKLKSDLLELQVANDMQDWQDQVARLTKAVQYLQDSLEFAGSESDNDDDDVSDCASSLTDAFEKEKTTIKSPGEASVKSAAAALNATFTDDARDCSIDLEHMEEARLFEHDDSNATPSEERILSPPRQSSVNDDTMSSSSIAGITHLFSLDSDQVLESYNYSSKRGIVAHASKFMSPSSSSPSLEMTKSPEGVNRQDFEEAQEALVNALSERNSLLDQLSLLQAKQEQLEIDLKTKVKSLQESGDKNRSLEAALSKMKTECNELKQKFEFDQKRFEEERLSKKRQIAILQEELETLQSRVGELKSERNQLVVEKEEIQKQMDERGTEAAQEIGKLELQVQDLLKIIATKEEDLKLTYEAMQKSESSLGELRVSYETQRKDFESEMNRLRKIHEGELYRAQEKIQKLQDQDAAHEDACREYREQIAVLQKREALYENEIREARDQIETIQERETSYKKELQQARNELGMVLEREVERNDRLQQLENASSSNISQIRSKLEKTEQALKSRTEDNSALRAQLEKTTSELASAREQNQALAANSRQEHHEIDRLKRAEKELVSVVNTLEVEKKTLETKIACLSDELVQTHRQVQELNVKCSEDSRSVVDKEEELRRLEQALEESQSVLGSLKESYVACNEQLANYASTQREQEAELEEAKTMIRAAEDLASTAEHRFLEVQNRLQHVTSERDSLLQEKGDLEERLERSKCSLRLAEARLREGTAAHQNDISALESAHANIVSDLKEKLEKVEADLESNNSELSSAHREIEGLRCMVAQLTDRCRKAEALQVDLEEVSRALSSSETDRRDLADLLSQNERTVVDLRNEKNNLTTKCNRLRDYIRKLTGKCDEWEEFHEKQAGVLQKLKQANERTQRKAAKLAHWLQQRDLIHTEEKAMWTTERSNIQHVHAQLEQELEEISRELEGVVPRPVTFQE